MQTAYHDLKGGIGELLNKLDRLRAAVQLVTTVRRQNIWRNPRLNFLRCMVELR